MNSWQASSTPPANPPGCPGCLTCWDQTLPLPRRARIARPSPGRLPPAPGAPPLLSFGPNPAPRHVCQVVLQHPLPTPPGSESPAPRSGEVSAGRRVSVGAPRPAGGPRRSPAAPAEPGALTPRRRRRGRGSPASLCAQGCFPRPHFSCCTSMGAGAVPRSPVTSRGQHPAPTRRVLASRAQTDGGAGLGVPGRRAFPAGGGGTVVRVRASSCRSL